MGQPRSWADVNVAIAVATDAGLVVPVVHRADTLTLEQVVARRIELVERARAGRLAPDDLAGGTFTISNLGMFGVDSFDAILNAPQAAILAVGRIADRVVAVNGAAVVRPTAASASASTTGWSTARWARGSWRRSPPSSRNRPGLIS